MEQWHQCVRVWLVTGGHFPAVKVLAVYIITVQIMTQMDSVSSHDTYSTHTVHSEQQGGNELATRIQTASAAGIVAASVALLYEACMRS